jgi:hypothetical protein
MGRNHFSQQGGPYFINDGVSKHAPHHSPEHTHEEVKPSYGFLATLAVLAIVVPVGLALFMVANL